MWETATWETATWETAMFETATWDCRDANGCLDIRLIIGQYGCSFV